MKIKLSMIKAEKTINESDIYNKHTEVFRGISSWIIDLVIDQTISISEYNLLSGSKLDHPRKRLINIQNFDEN